MQVVVKSAVRGHAEVERVLSGVTERRVAEVVRQRDRFREVFVKAKLPRNGSADLCDFQTVRQPRAGVVVGDGREDLRLAHQPPEGRRVDYSLSVALK